jgi:nitric oxide reductase activation protein
MLKDIDESASMYADSYIEDFKRDVSPEAWEEMVADGKIKSIRDDIAKRRARVLKSELEDKLRDKLRSLMGSEFLDALDKAVKYKADELSGRMQKQIKELEESDYYEESIGKELAVTDGQRKITWQRALSDDHYARVYNNAKIDMKSQINKLKKKIDLYGATQVHNIYNQKRGILDKRQLHRIPMGMTDLFKATVVKTDKPLDICLLVDESGSMGWSTMASARKSAIAIKEALADNPMINLWVYGHSADEKVKGQTEMIEYYSPTMQDRPFAMGGMNARYENRDGNAIIASAQRVKAESDNTSNKLMIVLSDGQPSADLYRGSRGIEHTAKAVKFAESRGWSVIQVGFAGASEHYMSQMFTNHIYVNDVETLGDNLSKIIRKVVKV